MKTLETRGVGPFQCMEKLSQLLSYMQCSRVHKNASTFSVIMFMFWVLFPTEKGSYFLRNISIIHWDALLINEAFLHKTKRNRIHYYIFSESDVTSGWFFTLTSPETGSVQVLHVARNACLRLISNEKTCDKLHTFVTNTYFSASLVWKTIDFLSKFRHVYANLKQNIA